MQASRNGAALLVETRMVMQKVSSRDIKGGARGECFCVAFVTVKMRELWIAGGWQESRRVAALLVGRMVVMQKVD